MQSRATVVLDVGKTLTKLSLWGPGGELLERRSRPNERVHSGRGLALDVAGIERFAAGTLEDFGRRARIGLVIPVAHGAAAAWIHDGRLLEPPLDYEQPIPDAVRREYLSQRDPFALTGSPALPDGLNLGAQLHYLEALRGALPAEATLVPWAQYWSWRLSGMAAADVTHLGCHTDLWFPLQHTHSRLSVARGWAARLAPLAPPSAVLGTLTPAWAQRTGLPGDVEVLCGLHDSNAALLAARAFAELAGQEATLLSTGTWFVAMRTPGAEAPCDLAALPEARDCLVNVDAAGAPVPSARFMGGREIELLGGGERVDAPKRQQALLGAVAAVLKRGSRVLPTLAPGSGPFPAGMGPAGAGPAGPWVLPPEDPAERLAAVCLYAALVADVCLDLIGTRERLLIEGRFARCEVLTQALAALRPQTRVYVASSDSEVAFGALRLSQPELAPASHLTPVAPLLQRESLEAYRQRWRQEAARAAL